MATEGTEPNGRNCASCGGWGFVGERFPGTRCQSCGGTGCRARPVGVHPSDFIPDELAARGWTQDELAARAAVECPSNDGVFSKRGITGLDGKSILVSTDRAFLRELTSDSFQPARVVILECGNVHRVLASASLAWSLADALREAVAELDPAYRDLMDPASEKTGGQR